MSIVATYVISLCVIIGLVIIALEDYHFEKKLKEIRKKAYRRYVKSKMKLQWVKKTFPLTDEDSMVYHRAEYKGYVLETDNDFCRTEGNVKVVNVMDPNGEMLFSTQDKDEVEAMRMAEETFWEIVDK